MRPVLALTATVLLFLGACDEGNDETQGTATTGSPTAPATQTATPGIPTETAEMRIGLNEYDFDSMLLVKGRDRLRTCVEVLDDSVRVEDTAEMIQEALLAAMQDSRWPDDFGTPAVDVGCPLPPLALEETSKDFAERKVCRREVSPYLVFVFVGNASLFEERFPESVLATARVPGTRKAIQEDIALNDNACTYDVSEAWYLTPEELSDSALLETYTFDIFPIADVGVR